MWGELWLGFPHTPSLRHPLAQCESEGTWERRGQCTKRCFSPPTSSSYKWWALRSSWLPTGNISLKCRCLISCKSVHTQHHSLASIYGLTSVNKVNLNTRTTDQRWGQRSAHKQKKKQHFSVSSLWFAGGECVAQTSGTASSWQQSHTSSRCTSPTSPCVRGIASAAHTSTFHVT